MLKDDCIFCKIIKGEIPSAKVYEDKDVLAFLDISPVNKGHTLVIPKQHHENLFDLPDDIAGKLALVLKNVSGTVKKAVNADGISVSMSNEKAAGQVVMHAHIHIIPRFSNDGLKLWPQGKYDEGEMQEYSEKIKRFL